MYWSCIRILYLDKKKIIMKEIVVWIIDASWINARWINRLHTKLGTRDIVFRSKTTVRSSELELEMWPVVRITSWYGCRRELWARDCLRQYGPHIYVLWHLNCRNVPWLRERGCFRTCSTEYAGSGCGSRREVAGRGYRWVSLAGWRWEMLG